MEFINQANNRELTELVTAAMDLGEQLLICGGEVFRVEDTIRRLCIAYGAKNVDVFTITSCVILTADFGEKGSISQSRRIVGTGFNLSALDALNDLSRRACSSRMTPAKLRSELDRINEMRKYSYGESCWIWALIASSFSVFFGGNGFDAVFAGGIGIILYIVQSFFIRMEINSYLSIVLCSLLGGFLSNLVLSFFHLPLNPAMINIGIIMLLIPGIALTNAIRDVFSGDTISGLLRFSEALVLSVTIAWGFAALASPSALTESINPWVQLTAGILGSLGFSLMFNVRGRRLVWCSVGGGVAWGMVLLCEMAGGTELMGYFIASVGLTVYAEILARRMRCPVTVFVATATIPLIPGGSLYRTMRFAMAEEWSSFAMQGLRTLLYAILISVGILIVMTAVHAWDVMKGRRQ